jgi:hypothetical protein
MNDFKKLGLQHSSVAGTPFELRAPKKCFGVFGASGTSIFGRNRKNSNSSGNRGTSGIGPVSRSRDSFGKSVARVTIKIVSLLLTFAKDAVIETVRCALFALRRRNAVRHSRSENPVQREFGRASLDYCAALLRRRTNRFLVPGKRTAQRLVGSAIVAAETALTDNDLSDANAEQWLSTFSARLDVHLLVAEDDGIKSPAAASQAHNPPAAPESEPESETPVATPPPSATGHSRVTRLQARPFPRAGAHHDANYITVQPTQIPASDTTEPTGFSFADEDEGLYAEVEEYLARERAAELEPVGHDGF